MSRTILRWPAVTAKVGLCKVKIQAMVNAGQFPRQISLGDRAVGFVDSEVDAWIDEQMAKRDAVGSA